MKKVLSLVLAVVMMMSLLAVTASAETDTSKVKVGFIFLHDENSTYDLNFLNAAKEACEKLGVEYLMKAINGETVEETINAPVEVVTAENGQAYLDNLASMKG